MAPTTKKQKQIIITVLLSCTTIALFSGCTSLTSAYLPTAVLNQGWHQNVALRNTGTQGLGLEKWTSLIYEINGNYPAFLTITTLKTLVLISEDQLQQRIQETITDTFQEQIEFNESLRGERLIQQNHRTMYIVFNGTEITTQEKVKIIGEVWNCGASGTSIICIGIAYLTNTDIPNVESSDQWEKIVMDPDGTIEGFQGENGLLYNIICH